MLLSSLRTSSWGHAWSGDFGGDGINKHMSSTWFGFVWTFRGNHPKIRCFLIILPLKIGTARTPLCMYWISRGLGVLGFLRYIGFQSHNASFRATCEQKGREEKCWMLWFLLNQWSTGPTGVPEKLKQSETVGNSRKQSGAARRDRAKIVNPPFFCKKKRSAQSPFFFESATGNSWKQLGLVPLTRQKKSYLKPVYKENEP